MIEPPETPVTKSIWSMRSKRRPLTGRAFRRAPAARRTRKPPRACRRPRRRSRRGDRPRTPGSAPPRRRFRHSRQCRPVDRQVGDMGAPAERKRRRHRGRYATHTFQPPSRPPSRRRYSMPVGGLTKPSPGDPLARIGCADVFEALLARRKDRDRLDLEQRVGTRKRRDRHRRALAGGAFVFT